MQVRPAHIEALMLTAHENQGGDQVSQQTDHRHDEHHARVDRFVAADPANRADDDPDRDRGDHRGIDQCGEHLDAAVTVGGPGVAARRPMRRATRAMSSPVESESICIASDSKANEPETRPPITWARKMVAVRAKVTARAVRIRSGQYGGRGHGRVGARSCLQPSREKLLLKAY